MRKSIKSIVLVLLVVCLFIPSQASAGTIENMLPKKSPINGDNSITEEIYEIYDVDNYNFDDLYGLSQFFNESLNAMMGFVFVAGSFGFKLGLYIFQWSMHFPLFNDLARWTSNAVGWAGGDLFRSFLKIVSILVSVWVLVELFRRRYADSAKALGISILFLGLSMTLFNNMYTVLTNVNDASNAVSSAILSISQPSGDRDKGEVNKEVVAKVSNQIWENYILIPWQFGEFGQSMKPGTKIEKDSKDSIAQDTHALLTANADQREKLVKGWEKKYPSLTSDSGLGGRFVINITLFVTNTIFLLFLTTLALYQLFYKLAFLILAFLAPIVCLFAAWPRKGVWTVINWSLTWLGAGFYGVVVSFLLAFYLGISTQLYKLVPDLGWFMGGVLPQLVLVLMLVVFRKNLIQVFRSPLSQTQRAVGQMNDYFNKGEPLQSSSKRFSKIMDRVHDKAEGAMGLSSTSNANAKTRGSLNKPYLQKMLQPQNSNDEVAATSEAQQGKAKSKPGTAQGKLALVKQAKKDQNNDSKKKNMNNKLTDVTESSKKNPFPDQPQRGRIKNRQFIPHQEPSSSTKVPPSSSTTAKKLKVGEKQYKIDKKKATLLAAKTAAKIYIANKQKG
ncbi:hypothetical protein [Thermoactinomyces sp. DSM 45892]|uniref:hypothetical protein n=1 Tax=Thermoactinomyces sp. DSM 45892 TaxID=1882753 RepID=UPI000895E049|nr:hypothetical protein [Thermoactinomyces sp. DSM 45892]SDY82825.1 hypothetical protein SAMN05444416_1099 [Thermoactinomyces sp. DSM 45892]